MATIIALVPLLSVLVFIIEILIDTNCVSYPVSYIPLLFGLLHFFVIKPKMFRGPGIKVVYFIAIIRYLYNPIMLINSGYFSFNEMTSTLMYKSIILMAIEMLVIFLTIAFHKRNDIETIPIESSGYSLIVPVFFLILSIGWSLIDPVPISRYHSILSGATELYDTDLDDAARGLPRILSYTHKLLITSLVIFFYNWNNKKGGNNRFIFGLGLIIVIIATSFYTDQSRNSMFLPLLTVMFLFSKIYQKRKKSINIIFTIVIILSVGYLTLLKQFHTTSYSSSLLNKDNSSMVMERYFAGTIGVYECNQYEDIIVNKINKTTLLTETFGNMMFIGRLLNKENRTSVFYNDAVNSSSYIIPTICESYFHFGWLFCWLMPFIIIKLILYFDKLFLSSKRIDLSFVFAFIAVSMGWVHGGNFIICMTIFHKGLVLLLLYLINSYFGKHIVFNK